MKIPDLMKHKYIYLIISGLILVPGIVSLIFFGLKLGIDFTGGSVFQYQFEKDIQNQTELSKNVSELFLQKGVTVESLTFESNKVISIKTKPINTQTSADRRLSADIEKADEIKGAFAKSYPDLTQISLETVGPSVGKETTKKAFFALMVSSIGILLYIAFAFRNIPTPYSSFRFGVSALIAMLHDAFVVLGVFSLMGYFWNIEVDALFITAMLTVIGFSVHDTIVVFDRIRENLTRLPTSWPFAGIVNYSIVETLNRSLATSLTVVITLSALFILGGDNIKHFSFALLIGIISGTYSSIFNAAPILVIWEDFLKGRKRS